MLWPRILSSIALVLIVGCSGKGADGAKDAAASAPTAGPAAVPASGSEAAVEPAIAPVDVAGAYLVGCSAATGRSYVDDLDASEDVTACVVTGGTAGPADIGDVKLEVLKDGAYVEPERVVKNVDSPWHVGVKLPPEDAAKVSDFRLTFTPAGQAPRIVSTNNARFDWTQSPLFALLDVVKLIAGSLNAGSIAAFDPGGTYKKSVEKGFAAQLIFVTETLFPATIGLDGADAACAEAGKKLPVPLKWTAVLSTSKVDARDRIKAVSGILSFSDKLVGMPKTLWTKDRPHNLVQFSETGRSAELYVLGTVPPEFNAQVWTATKADGTYDAEAGSCNDWTDASADLHGGAGSALRADERWIEAGSRPCSRKARLYCFSTWEASGGL